MPNSKSQRRRPAQQTGSGYAGPNASTPAFPNVSARWLLSAGVIAIVAAVALGWLSLCLLYWQGSWQLLYHPTAAVVRTPASVGLAYEPVRFAATETGKTRLTGWWIPDDGGREMTVLYLHGADGNLGDSVDELAALHGLGLTVFAFDYRGYGQSEAGRPSEARMVEDAEWALEWLTATRHIAAGRIVVYGSGLGANLATEVAAGNSKLVGAVLEAPLPDAMRTVFDDPRSRLVPARWLVADRYDLERSSSLLQVPSLWILAQSNNVSVEVPPQAYLAVRASRTALWLSPPFSGDTHRREGLERWLDDLPRAR